MQGWQPALLNQDSGWGAPHLLRWAGGLPLALLHLGSRWERHLASKSPDGACAPGSPQEGWQVGRIRLGWSSDPPLPFQGHLWHQVQTDPKSPSETLVLPPAWKGACIHTLPTAAGHLFATPFPTSVEGQSRKPFLCPLVEADDRI